MHSEVLNALAIPPCNAHIFRMDTWMYRRMNPEQRFWSGVEKTDNCWNRNIGVRGGRYSYFRINGINVAAHRYSYELHFGEKVPDDMLICHRCDNPRCVNPHHLFIGSHKDNVRDCQEKGRRRTPKRGEESPFAKLTNAQVLEIRSTPHFIGFDKIFAERFGVCRQHIQGIRTGRTRKH